VIDNKDKFKTNFYNLLGKPGPNHKDAADATLSGKNTQTAYESIFSADTRIKT
jgi:hypothetical protein